MIDRLLFGLTWFSAVGTGLMAGLFFAFSVCIMTALGRLPHGQGIAAMQSINSTILNPVFGLVFSGTTLACVVLAIFSLIKRGEAGAAYVLAGSLLYLLVVVVTMVFNVPMNDKLAAVLPNSAGSIDLWSRYVTEWTAWNHVRTLASIASLVTFIIALRYR
ncbi:membrane protein [Paenibacillus swuensis]|uniref:Membrane protein n=1 Tax=Paenibacillus swuensis TaxID=1178515 RepID=A0A172TH27_9BACL|nr:anthrone oxygenase family protein [Paenibacillus swuensis]ANE46093.1 membrane protein [Paenibacillus swuensis]